MYRQTALVSFGWTYTPLSMVRLRIPIHVSLISYVHDEHVGHTRLIALFARN
jgi:hypothetical protein